jgi:hypothetical protein
MTYLVFKNIDIQWHISLHGPVIVHQVNSCLQYGNYIKMNEWSKHSLNEELGYILMELGSTNAKEIEKLGFC